MKKKNILLLGFGMIAIVAVIIAAYFMDFKTDEPKTEKVSKTTTTFKEEYESLNDMKNDAGQSIEVSIPKNNTVKTLSEDNIMSTLNKKTGIVYFGFPTCPWCRNVVGILTTIANENKVPVYYFNPSEMRSNRSNTYQQLLKKLDKYLDTNEDDEKVLYVPDVYFIKNGEIVGHNLGTVGSQSNPYEKLTSSQETELREIYQNYIDKIK